MEEAKYLLKSGATQEALKRLIDILPDFKDKEDEWKIHELIGAAFHDLGDAEGAVQSYLYAATKDKYLRSQRTHYSNYLFALHYLSKLTNEELAAEHFVYNKLFNEELRMQNAKLKNSIVNKITIGYIASYFTESSSSRFYEALLTEFNKEKFMVKCFSLSDEADNFTNLIKNCVDEFIILDNLSIEEAAWRIAEEGVDILFDLSGHTDGGMTLQIMSYKPAPIQISGIGWFDTTGLKAIDYILTDNYLDPIGQEKYFTEKLLRLNSAFAFKPIENMTNNYAFHIPHSELVFGSFNNFMKITDEYLKCVKKILNAVENSKFIMQDTTSIPARKIEMERRLQKLKMPVERIEVRLGNDNYLKDYAEIDIMLDTFPYTGGTMTATALYMGIPVINLYGTRHSSRFGADILRLAGMSEFIANNVKGYVNLAISLASNLENLIEIKKTLRERLVKSKLLDTKRFVAELEIFYKDLIMTND